MNEKEVVDYQLKSGNLKQVEFENEEKRIFEKSYKFIYFFFG